MFILVVSAYIAVENYCIFVWHILMFLFLQITVVYYSEFNFVKIQLLLVSTFIYINYYFNLKLNLNLKFARINGKTHFIFIDVRFKQTYVYCKITKGWEADLFWNLESMVYILILTSNCIPNSSYLYSYSVSN